MTDLRKAVEHKLKDLYGFNFRRFEEGAQEIRAFISYKYSKTSWKADLHVQSQGTILH